MIKIEHVVLPSPEQMEFVIEGMRNPMNSWDKSDSEHCKEDDCSDCLYDPGHNCFYCGPKDLSLMQKLSAAGTDHRKFMRMMPVMLRITAPLYWWKEFDTYKVGTVANSCSTMHKITEKEFDISDFSTEHLIYLEEDFTCKLLSPDGYPCGISPVGNLHVTIALLNKARIYFLEMERKLKEDVLTDNEREEITELKKLYWWQMIQLLPSSYNQTRNVMCNYECLKNMYRARKTHKLDEWVELAKWIETLPYSELIKED